MTIDSIPHDLWIDWERFASEPRTVPDITDWIGLKAMEYEFDFFELSIFLNIVVAKAKICALPAALGN